ncbi:MAG TPA: AsmA family protein [Caldimonas sp.]|nr:AsmA family protein [Caldimonas sp.]
MARERDRHGERYEAQTRPGADVPPDVRESENASIDAATHGDPSLRGRIAAGEGIDSAAPPRIPRPRRGIVPASIIGAIMLVALACEAAGWPFLVGPMQRWLTHALDREVTFAGEGAGEREGRGVHIGLLGSIRIDAASIQIAAPAWSKASHMVLAKNAQLRLGYRDLWGAAHGQPLRILGLRADRLDAQIERLQDGRASWQFGQAKQATGSDAAPRLPSFGELRVRDGTLQFVDEVMQADLDARFSLTERAGAGGATSAGPQTSPSPAAGSSPRDSRPEGLQFNAKGSYRKLPLRMELTTSSALAGGDTKDVAQPVRLDLVVGQARLWFRGAASDPLHLVGLRGRFEAEGPSLAALGDPLGVALPTTGPFKTQGLLDKEGDLWKMVFAEAAIGDSRLAGAFTYDRRGEVPVLAGRLTGTRLVLKDLAPALGASPHAAATPSGAEPHRVLPERRFDLPSLKAMNANLLVDIARADLGTPLLDAIEPLHAHLQLQNGVLGLTDIEARTAQGRVTGAIGLDGRDANGAIWTTDLQLAGVRLDQWLHQQRKGEAPPWVSGLLDGDVKVGGHGRSTAEILGTLEGGIRFHLRNGRLSHVALEVAGIDLAQALGVFAKGDDGLTIDCNVVDLVVHKGVARPRAFVFDTRDSTVWVEGSVSFANEALDLTAIVSPRDASPFTVRSPIHVRGTFSAPRVSLETGPAASRVGAAALLALVNPIAAVVPFIDPGARDDAKREAAACEALAKRESGAAVDPRDTARAAAAARPRR